MGPLQPVSKGCRGLSQGVGIFPAVRRNETIRGAHKLYQTQRTKASGAAIKGNAAARSS